MRAMGWLALVFGLNVYSQLGGFFIELLPPSNNWRTRWETTSETSAHKGGYWGRRWGEPIVCAGGYPRLASHWHVGTLV